MAPAPSLIDGSGLMIQPSKILSGLSIVSAIAEQLTPPSEIGSGLMTQPGDILSRMTSHSQKGEQKANRERLRLETAVTPTKQTPTLRSNREREALFPAPICLPSSSRPNAISIPRKLPTSPKITTAFPSILLRLKPTPTVYFLRVTGNFNLTMLRLKRTPIEPIFRSNGPSFPARKRGPNVAHVFRHEALRSEFALGSELALVSELPRRNPRVSNRESLRLTTHSNRENDAASQSMNPPHPAVHLTNL